MTWDCFEHKIWYHCIKTTFQKIENFLDTTSDDENLPRFVTKKWIEVYDQSAENYNINKEVRIKTSTLRSDLWDYSDAHIVVKGIITVANPENEKETKVLLLKIMHHSSIAFQKLMA